MEKHVFAKGGMWEFEDWEIALDCECSQYGGSKPCEHCHSERDKVHTRSIDDSQYVERVWICPRVVIARNEGGCNSTGVCLDCILEAATGEEP